MKDESLGSPVETGTELELELSEELVSTDTGLDEDVREFFVLLVKTIRAAQLYVQGNPLLHQFIGDLEDRLSKLWDEVSHLTLSVHENELRFQDRVVYRGRPGRPENLAFQFYRDGIRRIEFRPGVEDDELRQFIDVLRLSKTLPEEEDDLLTLMWNCDFSFIRYEYVDMLGEDPPMPETGLDDEKAAEQLPMLPQLELSPEMQRPTLREDFEPSLYFLDEADLSLLQQELRREWDRPTRRDVMLAVLDQFEMGVEERRHEVTAILRQMMPRVLAEGEFADAAFIVSELRKIAETKANPTITQEVDNIIGELSDPIVLEQLVRLMDDGSLDPSSEDLATLLGALQPEAITVLIHAIPAVTHGEVRQKLHETLERLARLNLDFMASLIQSPEPAVAAEAARIAGRLQMNGTAEVVASLLDRPEREVRLAAVESLALLRTSMSGAPLLGALTDASRDVRVAAAKGLAKMKYRPGYKELEDHVTGKELKTRDLTEQLAFFEAYALAAGQEGTRLLNRLLNGRRFLWLKHSSQVRACAARGLGLIGGEDAEAALNRALRDGDPMVMSAVHTARRGNREEPHED